MPARCAKAAASCIIAVIVVSRQLTAAVTVTMAAQVGAVVADVGAVTLEWLKKHEIPHDEVCFGKPWGQFYIDDLAVDAIQGDLRKAIGFYPTNIPAGKLGWPNAGPARLASTGKAEVQSAGGGSDVASALACTWPFMAGLALGLAVRQ